MLLQLVAVVVSAATPDSWPTQAADSAVLLRLEVVWNRAHVTGDTSNLADLWAQDLVVAVPGMPVMSKADLLGFWRSGRSTITRYETSNLRVRVYGEAAVVTGRLSRDRSFNARTATDHWQFTKVYARSSGRWRVVAYHASVAAGS